MENFLKVNSELSKIAMNFPISKFLEWIILTQIKDDKFQSRREIAFAVESSSCLAQKSILLPKIIIVIIMIGITEKINKVNLHE